MSGFSLPDWDDVGDLVEEALDLPAPERDGFLERACGGDVARAARARRVLAAAQRARHFLETPAADVAADLAADAAAAAGAGADLAAARDADPDAAPWSAPAGIGPYRILRAIGRGGMGDVVLADRADDEFTRLVAIKIVRPGLGEDLVARFRHERQVLASLDHPNIAQLYDGGVAGDGRPYLVMEYVDGQPLDRFADAGRLTIDERVAIFLQICDAVDSAHRRLVVHRDLKPSNVLVTRDGTAKLLDFGVAKLLEPDASAEAPVTRAGFRLMTPEYASPEQFQGAPTTTATDVYALGALLYELLTGVRPREAVGRPLAALEHEVVARDPEPPSAACRRTSVAGTPDARAAARATTVDALARRLRGDLDTIVLTAMRREPDRRYPSAAALREDLERHRAGLPVTARPATVTYRAAKFVRRHRAGVAAAVLVAAAAVAGTTSTLVQARAAAREGRRAEQIRDFLISVFEVSAPDASHGETITARELLDRGSTRVDRELSGEPILHAEMLGVLGRLYGQLGLFDRSRTQLETAVSLQRNAGAPALALVDSLTSLAATLTEQDALDAASDALDEALTLAHDVDGPAGPAVASVLSELAGVRRRHGDFAASETLNRQAIGMRRTLGDPAALGDALNGLGVLLSENGHAAESVDLLTESLALQRRAHGDAHTKVALAECNLATSLHRAGRLDEAIAAFDTCLADRRALLGDRHPDVAVSLNTLALVHSDRNEYADAERLYLEALGIQREAFGPRHTAVAATLNNLAILEFQRGRFAEAADRFRELVDVWTSLVGPDHPNTLATTNNLGMALRSAGDLAGAERVLASVLEGRQRTLGADHPETAMSLVNLGTVLERESQYARARDLVKQAIPTLERAYAADHPNTAIAYVMLGRVELALGRPAPALEAFEHATAMRERIFGLDHLQTCEARIGQGRALTALGRPAEGRAMIVAALEALEAAGHGDGPTAKMGREALGEG